jgi:hypothetical protein
MKVVILLHDQNLRLSDRLIVRSMEKFKVCFVVLAIPFGGLICIAFDLYLAPRIVVAMGFIELIAVVYLLKIAFSK